QSRMRIGPKRETRHNQTDVTRGAPSSTTGAPGFSTAPRNRCRRIVPGTACTGSTAAMLHPALDGRDRPHQLLDEPGQLEGGVVDLRGVVAGVQRPDAGRVYGQGVEIGSAS